jgi:hypothetical protein
LYVVDEETVTFTVEALTVAGVPFAFFFGAERLAEENPDTVNEPDVTAVTLPLANPTLERLRGRPEPPPGMLPPLGGPPDPPPGKLPPLGGPPDPPPGRLPPLGGPPDLLPAKPPSPPEHCPEVGWLTVTVMAFTALDFFEVRPVTVTQSPTATDDAETSTIWLKVVDVVQLTVTCPDSWLWTSIEVPVMAATDPEAPGKERCADEPDDVEAAAAIVVTPRASATVRAAEATGSMEKGGARRLMVLFLLGCGVPARCRSL